MLAARSRSASRGRRSLSLPPCRCGSTTFGVHAPTCPRYSTRRGTPAAAVLAGGISRHGCSCWCRHCAAARTAPTPTPTPTPPYVDARPRCSYRLPSGEVVQIICDHGERIRPFISYQLTGGGIVTATLVGATS